MNKKGFTLIELLAVIVVLAIIALISTPMVLNIIDTAKEGAAKSSGYAYISSVETQLATYMLKNNGNSYAKGKYSVENLKTNLDVKLKGTEPTVGNVCIGSDGTITKASLKISDYVVNYDGNKATNTDLEEIEDISCDGNDYTDEDNNTPSEPENTVNGLTAGTYNTGDSVSYAGVDWYVISDNGDNVTLITKSNISQGYYGNDSDNLSTWETSNAKTTVTSWLNNNSQLLAAQNNSLLVQDSTGDYIRLPRSNELSTSIPNSSNSYFWTMTSDDSSSNATTHYMILGAPDGNIGTYTTYTGSPSLYYAQPEYHVDCVSTSMLTELDIEEGPVTNVVAIPGAGAVSDKITINMVTEVSSTMTTYYSNSMYTATTSANGAVCHQTYGVSPNVPLVVGKKYAAGSACDKYTIYSIVSEYSNGVVKDVGFRPVITIKEQ